MDRMLSQVLAAGALLTLAPAAAAQTQQWSAPTQQRPASAPKAGPARVLAAGDKVQVSWTDGWYDATVLAVGQGNYKVRYDGWSSDWDEWVTPARMRLAGGGAIAAPPSAPTQAVVLPPQPETPAPPAPPSPAPAAPAPKVLSSSPWGRYRCRTFEANQVNSAGEFLLRADGSYHDFFSKAGGRFRYDAAQGRITFTSGPQATTKPVITFFASGHAGKGHIVFDYGAGARLDCYRESLP